jgi:hypothetical protein
MRKRGYSSSLGHPFLFCEQGEARCGSRDLRQKKREQIPNACIIDANFIQQEDIMREAKFSKPLTIALHPVVYDRVKQITDVQSRSMADWVREAIDRVLDENSTATSFKEDKSNEHRI